MPILFILWFALAIILMTVINNISAIVNGNHSAEEKIELLKLFLKDNIIVTLLNYRKFMKSVRIMNKINETEQQNTRDITIISKEEVKK